MMAISAATAAKIHFRINASIKTHRSQYTLLYKPEYEEGNTYD